MRRESGQWADGASFALASGLMGVLGASNDEVEGSNNATLIASFTAIFLVIVLTYRSFAIGFLLCISLGTATLVSLAYMYLANIGFDVNTLPVQALGVGVGVDYGLYLMDRMVHERKRGHDIDESIRISITTTGMAVFFTGSTLVGGIIFWYFISSLRFAADMSLLMSIVLAANMVGAMVLVPAMTSMFKPQFASGETVEELHKREPSAGVERRGLIAAHHGWATAADASVDVARAARARGASPTSASREAREHAARCAQVERGARDLHRALRLDPVREGEREERRRAQAREALHRGERALQLALRRRRDPAREQRLHGRAVHPPERLERDERVQPERRRREAEAGERDRPRREPEQQRPALAESPHQRLHESRRDGRAGQADREQERPISRPLQS